MTLPSPDPGARLLLLRLERFEQWNHANLSAPYYRLYHNRERGAAMELAGRRTSMVPSDLYLIPPNTPFCSSNTRPVDHLYIHFHAHAPYESIAPELFAFQLRGDLQSLTHELEHLLGAGRDTPRAPVLALALAHWALAQIPEDRLPSLRSDERVDAAIAAMTRALAAPPSNPELAKLVGMSTNAFIRLFHAVTGRSPQAFLRTRRIDQTCVLLHTTRLSIDEIAERAGFGDRHHFSRVFKHERGLGPAEFRKNAGHSVP